MSVSIEQVQSFASEQLERAKGFARTIRFSRDKEARSKMLANEAFEIRASIEDDPDFSSLSVSDGISAWTSIMSVDLRDSTKLADQVSAREMYLLIHTLLPTLAYVCERSDGDVMNFRGDGLFAGFGLKKITESEPEPTKQQKLDANRQAVVCGLNLIEAVSDGVEVVLSDDGIEVDLHAGVGIDCGQVTVTRVGWMSAGELTAYGSCVNQACKLSNARDQVVVSSRVTELYPSGAGGKLQFRNNVGDGYVASCDTSLMIR